MEHKLDDTYSDIRRDMCMASLRHDPVKLGRESVAVTGGGMRFGGKPHLFSYLLLLYEQWIIKEFQMHRAMLCGLGLAVLFLSILSTRAHPSIYQHILVK